MSDTLQIVLPFATALSVLGVFHTVAYLHLRLSEDEASSDESDSELLRS
jgi:Flp pilus assembly protein protease CpaA